MSEWIDNIVDFIKDTAYAVGVLITFLLFISFLVLWICALIPHLPNIYDALLTVLKLVMP